MFIDNFLFITVSCRAYLGAFCSTYIHIAFLLVLSEMAYWYKLWACIIKWLIKLRKVSASLFKYASNIFLHPLFYMNIFDLLTIYAPRFKSLALSYEFSWLNLFHAFHIPVLLHKSDSLFFRNETYHMTIR